jgi:hypothetical protein
VGRSAGQAHDIVPFFQQKFGQIRAILAGDTGDEGNGLGGHLILLLN